MSDEKIIRPKATNLNIKTLLIALLLLSNPSQVYSARPPGIREKKHKSAFDAEPLVTLPSHLERRETGPSQPTLSQDDFDILIQLAKKGDSEAFFKHLLEHQVSSITLISIAHKKNGLPVMDMLYENGADVDHADEEGVTVLMRAVMDKNPAEVHLLIRHGADVDKINKRSLTAVHLAIGPKEEDFSAEIFQALVQNSSAINALSSKGLTLLMYAVHSERLPAIQILIANGADVTKKARNGETLLNYALLVTNKEEIWDEIIDTGKISEAELSSLKLQMEQKKREKAAKYLEGVLKTQRYKPKSSNETIWPPTGGNVGLIGGSIIVLILLFKYFKSKPSEEPSAQINAEASKRKKIRKPKPVEAKSFSRRTDEVPEKVTAMKEEYIRLNTVLTDLKARVGKLTELDLSSESNKKVLKLAEDIAEQITNVQQCQKIFAAIITDDELDALSKAKKTINENVNPLKKRIEEMSKELQKTQLISDVRSKLGEVFKCIAPDTEEQKEEIAQIEYMRNLYTQLLKIIPKLGREEDIAAVQLVSQDLRNFLELVEKIGELNNRSLEKATTDLKAEIEKLDMAALRELLRKIKTVIATYKDIDVTTKKDDDDFVGFRATFFVRQRKKGAENQEEKKKKTTVASSQTSLQLPASTSNNIKQDKNKKVKTSAPPKTSVSVSDAINTKKCPQEQKKKTKPKLEAVLDYAVELLAEVERTLTGHSDDYFKKYPPLCKQAMLGVMLLFSKDLYNYLGQSSKTGQAFISMHININHYRGLFDDCFTPKDVAETFKIFCNNLQKLKSLESISNIRDADIFLVETNLLHIMLIPRNNKRYQENQIIPSKTEPPYSNIIKEYFENQDHIREHYPAKLTTAKYKLINKLAFYYIAATGSDQFTPGSMDGAEIKFKSMHPKFNLNNLINRGNILRHSDRDVSLIAEIHDKHVDNRDREYQTAFFAPPSTATITTTQTTSTLTSTSTIQSGTNASPSPMIFSRMSADSSR